MKRLEIDVFDEKLLELDAWSDRLGLRSDILKWVKTRDDFALFTQVERRWLDPRIPQGWDRTSIILDLPEDDMVMMKLRFG